MKVVQQRASLGFEFRRELREPYCADGRVFVPCIIPGDVAVAFFTPEQEFPHTSGFIECVHLVADVFEPNEKIADDFDVVSFTNSPHDIGGYGGFDDDASLPRRILFLYGVFGENGGDFVAVDEFPATAMTNHESDAVGVRITIEQNISVDFLGEP